MTEDFAPPHAIDYIGDDERYEQSELRPEWYNNITITYGELLEAGLIDWESDNWKWDYFDEEQYKRVCTKIDNHYYDREIGVLPPERWQRHFLRIINEIMPSLKPLYKALKNNPDIVLSESNRYFKNRNVFSDLPATQLSPEQDYASTATDNEGEEVTNGDFIEKAIQIQDEYTDLDMIIINKLDTCFSSILTSHLNNY